MQCELCWSWGNLPACMPSNLASHRFTIPSGLVQCESMLVIGTPSAQMLGGLVNKCSVLTHT